MKDDALDAAVKGDKFVVGRRCWSNSLEPARDRQTDPKRSEESGTSGTAWTVDSGGPGECVNVPLIPGVRKRSRPGARDRITYPRPTNVGFPRGAPEQARSRIGPVGPGQRPRTTRRTLGMKSSRRRTTSLGFRSTSSSPGGPPARGGRTRPDRAASASAASSNRCSCALQKKTRSSADFGASRRARLGSTFGARAGFIRCPGPRSPPRRSRTTSARTLYPLVRRPPVRVLVTWINHYRNAGELSPPDDDRDGGGAARARAIVRMRPDPPAGPDPAGAGPLPIGRIIAEAAIIARAAFTRTISGERSGQGCALPGASFVLDFDPAGMAEGRRRRTHRSRTCSRGSTAGCGSTSCSGPPKLFPDLAAAIAERPGQKTELVQICSILRPPTQKDGGSLPTVLVVRARTAKRIGPAGTPCSGVIVVGPGRRFAGCASTKAVPVPQGRIERRPRGEN